MRRRQVEFLHRFYRDHRRELFTYALSLTHCGDSAEDAVHTAFARILERGRLPRELRPYAFRCVRNAAIDHLRIASREVHDESLFDGAQPKASAEDARLRMDFEKLLEALSDDERECIILKVYSSLTFNEISDLRGVSINTAASWYRRGIEKLRRAMSEGLQ